MATESFQEIQALSTTYKQTLQCSCATKLSPLLNVVHELLSSLCRQDLLMLASLVVCVGLRPSNMKYYDIERCWDLKTLSPLLFRSQRKAKDPYSARSVKTLLWDWVWGARLRNKSLSQMYESTYVHSCGVVEGAAQSQLRSCGLKYSGASTSCNPQQS